MRDYSAELQQARALLSDLVAHAQAFDVSRLAFVPAVIDRSTTSTVVWRSEETTGIRKFVESMVHHLGIFDSMAASSCPPREDPLPVALGLATSWKSIVLASAPIPAVRMAVRIEEPWDGKGRKPQPKGKQREAFVDVVARGGAEWIRIYSKKPSQLLAEFREADSYLTSDFEDSDDESDGEGSGSGSGSEARRPPRLNNSITRLVDELLSLAEEVDRVPGVPPPALTVRLSRIQEHPEGGHPDARIPETFAAVRARGVKLVFGDLSDIPISSLPIIAQPPRPTVPTRRVNLDPTALTGLCSDLLHYPLPESEDAAKARFFRPEHLVGDSGQSQNSRELVRALMEEMEAPLIEQIRDALAGQEIELWATRQAVTYLQETISSEDVVGKGEEQRRMRCLAGLEDGDFWLGSRYEGKEGGLKNIRLHVFDEPETYPAYLQELVRQRAAGDSDHNTKENGQADCNSTPSADEPLLPPIRRILSEPLCSERMTSFHHSTSSICSAFLDEYMAHLSNPTPASASALPSFLNPRRLPSPRVAQISIPFTVVSLHSLARGAHEGMTTMSMGHVVFRELFGQPRWRPKGWVQSNYDLEGIAGEAACSVNAVAWILPYRSLGEAKRIKFENADYSFPTFVQRGPQSASRVASEAASAAASGGASPAESTAVTPAASPPAGSPRAASPAPPAE